MTQAEALDILKTGANVFLTGEPGSGKTHTINEYVTWLRSHGVEPAITASTGIASTHIGGMTIHAWSGIGILDHLTASDLDRIMAKEHVVKRIERTQVLIIDEISMLSAETLSMVDTVMRQVKREGSAFGGVQVIFCGDFFQLPPISRGGQASSFAFSSSSWRSSGLITCYLTEQHRQEDSVYLGLLSRMRRCENTEEDALIIEESHRREIETEDIPRLHTHNSDVDSVNQKKLLSIDAPEHVFTMESDGSSTLVENLKRGCLSPERLVLKKGAVVMCTKNNPAGGYANGTLGKVTGFVRGSGEPIVETYDGREITVGRLDWVIEENGKIRARISQIPLRLAWAITIHKSQGMSLDSAVIDLGKTFEYGQGYVALSRVRSLDGLILTGWCKEASQLHPEVLRIDERFREESLAAQDAFMTLREENDLEPMHKNFLLAIGGSIEAKDKGAKASKKKSTYALTEELLLAGLPLQEIAKERGLTLGTIADHAEKLIDSGAVHASNILSAIPAKLVASLPDIHGAFEKCGAEKLAPAYHELLGKYSYDDLKIARILFQSAEETQVR